MLSKLSHRIRAIRSLYKGSYGPYDKKTQYHAVVGRKDSHTDRFKATEDTAKFRFGTNWHARHVPIKSREGEEWCNFSSLIQMLLVHALMRYLVSPLRSIRQRNIPYRWDTRIRAIFWTTSTWYWNHSPSIYDQKLNCMSNVNTRGCIRSITVGGDGQTVNILHKKWRKRGKMVYSRNLHWNVILRDSFSPKPMLQQCSL